MFTIRKKESRTPYYARAVAAAFFAFSLACRSAAAQTFQFLPEVDAYTKIAPNIRFSFQAKETREAGDPTQAAIGPSFDFYVKPLVRLEKISIFDPDEAKAQLFQLFAGFRYLASPTNPHTERLEVGLIVNFPLHHKILFSDRNRMDLDWSRDVFTWRYRNRAKLQRAINIGPYRPAPYLGAEFFYLSQLQKWSTTALFAGCLLPLGKNYSLDAYYEHQNITRGPRNQQLNQLGLIL